MMKYIFILGNNPSLSIAELLAKISCKNYEYIGFSAFLAEVPEELIAKKLIKELGGTIKIAKVYSEVKNNGNDILAAVKKLLPTEHEGKFKFGFSFYGSIKLNVKRIAMETKKKLKLNNISCRWVTSKENTLSSVVVGQNKLDAKGLEVIIAQKGDMFLVAKTQAVQDYKTLSFRDYNRPARDDKSGMLPPKLAQIMINLANCENKDKVVLLDPFCGSGTVLMEAALMGFRHLIGSDLSEKAVKDTEENTKWVKDKFNVNNLDYNLYNKSATDLSQVITKESVDCIVTEPYLGPQRGRLDVVKIKRELEELYSRAISEFKKILKRNGRVVMLWPVIRVDQKRRGTFLNPNYDGFKIVNPLPVDMQNKKYQEQSARNTIVYGREGQRIWREIVVLSKEL
jgi:tRNA G10  N-methylase Trm11